MERIEQTIRRNDTAQADKDKLKYNFFFALAASFSILAILAVVLALSAAKAILFLPVIFFFGLAVLFFLLKDEMLLEYDYVVEDDVFTIAKIKNLSSRKEILRIPVKNFKRLETASPERIASLDKKIFCSLNENKKLLFFEENGETRVLIFEPNDEFIRQIERELKR